MTRRQPIATWPCACNRTGCWCHSRVQAMGEWCGPCGVGEHARLPLPWPAQGPQDGRQLPPRTIRTPRPQEPIQ